MRLGAAAKAAKADAAPERPGARSLRQPKHLVVLSNGLFSCPAHWHSVQVQAHFRAGALRRALHAHAVHLPIGVPHGLPWGNGQARARGVFCLVVGRWDKE
jgi:hypothetical protein